MVPVQRELDPAEARAISVVWTWYLRNQNKYDVPFSTVVMQVRARCSSTDIERIKVEFVRRHRRALQRGVWG